MIKGSEGNVGFPIEKLMYDYLASNFTAGKVTHEPGKYPAVNGVTCPDVLVKGTRSLYIDVTISVLGQSNDPKRSQRQIFNNPINEDILGIAVYQQVVMLPSGYDLVLELAHESMKSRMQSKDAQKIIDTYCASYAYSFLNAFTNDWEITATKLRAALRINS